MVRGSGLEVHMLKYFILVAILILPFDGLSQERTLSLEFTP